MEAVVICSCLNEKCAFWGGSKTTCSRLKFCLILFPVEFVTVSYIRLYFSRLLCDAEEFSMASTFCCTSWRPLSNGAVPSNRPDVFGMIQYCYLLRCLWFPFGPHCECVNSMVLIRANCVKRSWLQLRSYSCEIDGVNSGVGINSVSFN